MTQQIDALRKALKALESCRPSDYSSGHVIHQSFDQALCEEAELAVFTALQTEECRGYAVLGIGEYLLNYSAPGQPAELIITLASDEDKAGRVVGEERYNTPDTLIQPEQMVVRLRFENPAGLDALESQLRHVRAVHFADTFPRGLTMDDTPLDPNIPSGDQDILRAAVAAMPHTDPLVAEDLIQGFTMHTEAEDIIAIWKAAVASVSLPPPVAWQCQIGPDSWGPPFNSEKAMNGLLNEGKTLRALRVV